LIEEGDIKVVCSTTLKDEKTMGNKLITDLFYGRPTIEIKNGKIYFSANLNSIFLKKETYLFNK